MPRAKKVPTPEGERDKTRRVVLERVSVVVIPPELAGKPADEVATRLKALVAKPVVAWVERGEFTGTRSQAIKAYAGEPGTPDAKPGEYKAPPARGLRGGMRYTRPERPLVAAETID